MTKTARPMSCYEFGRRLLETNDIDPVYVAVWNAGLAPEELRRWLLAYWCFYHSGTTSYVASAPDGTEGYWIRMRTAAESKEFPRGTERRHFRGELAARSVTFLADLGLDYLFDPFQPAASYTAGEVIRTVGEWYGFGPWIAFKVADMLDRLGLCRVEFDVSTAFYKGSPTEGSERLWREERNSDPPSLVTTWAARRILTELGTYAAPPRYERKINVQEAETVICKWNSYRKGHYEPGEDVKGLRHHLLRFGKCTLSQRILAGGRKGGLW